ncbi:serine/threonine protein phosphatase [Streptomyces triticagri]|uniref:Serine/threonine protein phosphatase n=1 Tax=Streptomyces triticagri TaxID=2293568 RepID=A0A372LZ42_9ACTN|nr:protein phosphatase 2C domain-containing protein [Streptomyces triticagri]RFU83829.1 serine/threonine protein phosphatase [Streptomyces triticagri]
MTIPPQPARPPGPPAPEAPAAPPTAATPRPWSADHTHLQALTVWTERRPGHGEDAEPLAAHHLPSANGLLAVFDGSGGSGAAPAWSEPDGPTHTNAWVGARIARLAAECWFQRVVLHDEPDTRDRLEYSLRRMLASAPARARTRIGGSMRRALPTTLAAVRYGIDDEGVRWRALWAGDSRSYALLPGSGLHALTRDDTHEEDALAQLRQDPPMTNVICADRTFTVNTHEGRFREPCVLLTATDGFFGYVHTPAQFECLLLATLTQARDAAQWASLLTEAIVPITADDASLSLVALGFEDFGSLRKAFTERYEGVARGGYQDVPPADDQEALRLWQDRTWQSYRTEYEKLMPGVRE